MGKKDQKIYRLKLTLNDIKPPIWRRVLVPANTLLPDLHKIIQTSMGWSNGHLHQFKANGKFYGVPFEDQFSGMKTIDYKYIRIYELLKQKEAEIIYEYDFGDGWEHIITLGDILTADPEVDYPICIKGKRNCPPEDCGGPWGYQSMLEVLKNPDHEEYEMFEDWLGEMYIDKFDPERFDKERVNQLLHSKNYGVFEL
jgi:hypothetical protein